jgi:aerobic-type carbon monoxide dehydrogenase small subunit (CoxS/CutS family)
MSERGAGVGPGERLRLRLVVNRRPVELLVPPHRTLLEVLRELLERNPTPSREEIRLAISGNLCRCPG